MTYSQLEQGLRSSSRKANGGNLIGITTKRVDVLFGPLESLLYIPKGRVRCPAYAHKRKLAGGLKRPSWAYLRARM